MICHIGFAGRGNCFRAFTYCIAHSVDTSCRPLASLALGVCSLLGPGCISLLEGCRVQLRRGVLALDRFLEGLLVGLSLSDEGLPSIVELSVRRAAVITPSS